MTYLFNGISQLAIAILSFYIYFSFYKKGAAIKQIGNILGVNGIFYLTFSFLSILGFSMILVPSQDFILIHTILTVMSTVLLLYSVYKITANKNLIYLFLLFLVTIFSIIYSINTFFLTTIIISYLLLIIVFLDLVIFANFYLKTSGYFGIAYTILSALFLLLIISGVEPSGLLWFIPNTILFFVFLFIFLDIKNLGIIKSEKSKGKKPPTIFSYILLFFKFLLFIMSISPFVLLSTISIHEVGHALSAQYYGCEYSKAVIYDILGSPHTEIRCSSEYNDTVLTLGGVLAPFIFLLIFLLIGNEFTTKISWLILGFSLLISYGDLNSLSISKNIVFGVMFIAYIIILLSIVKLSIFFLKQQNLFKDGIKESIKHLSKSPVEVKKILKYDNNKGLVVENEKR